MSRLATPQRVFAVTTEQLKGNSAFSVLPTDEQERLLQMVKNDLDRNKLVRISIYPR